MNINEKTNGKLLPSILYTTSSGVSSVVPVNTSYIILILPQSNFYFNDTYHRLLPKSVNNSARHKYLTWSRK